MKSVYKYLLCLVVPFILVTGGICDEPKGYGFKFGMLANSFRGNGSGKFLFNTQGDQSSFNAAGGFTARFFYMMRLNKSLIFQPEIGYIGKGARQDFREPNHNAWNIDYRFDYVHIPLTFILDLKTAKNPVSISAGPFLSYAFSVNAGGKLVEHDGDVYSFDLDVPDGKKLAYGVSAGIQIEIINRVLIDIQYERVLSNIVSESLKHSSLSLTLGYIFL